MKPLLFCFLFSLLILIAGCSSTKSPTDIIPPELLYQFPLPAFPVTVSRNYSMRIPMEIRVAQDGSVTDVRMKTGNTDAAWDSAAQDAIRRWRYTPARVGNRAIAIWVHQTAVIRFTEPVFYTLAEIVCRSRSDADSSIAMLHRGKDFADVVIQYSMSNSRQQMGDIGRVNIMTYPEDIRKNLLILAAGQWTEPLSYGGRYVIFKRLSE